jgi:DNA mismatch endonuclease (patch repair protein)
MACPQVPSANIGSAWSCEAEVESPWIQSRPRLRKIIEVRGCFWHQHKGCIDGHLPKSRKEYWRPKLAKNTLRDKSNEKALKAQGWRILTLWECEVGELVRLRRRIRTFLESAH